MPSGNRTLMVANAASVGRGPRSRSRIARVISTCDTGVCMDAEDGSQIFTSSRRKRQWVPMGWW